MAAQTDSTALLARAHRLMREAPFIDGHNDMPWEIRTKGGSDPIRMNIEGALPNEDTDVPRMRRGGMGGQFWAAYPPTSSIGHGALRVTLEQIDLIHRMVAHAPSLALARTAADVERIHREGKIASLIGIEGGHGIESSLGALRQVYALGARYMTLTHSSTIDWADAATDSLRHGGLTKFGQAVVREMNRLGMLVDLSHVSDGTMSDALRVSEAPVIFSHSSARALADHPRNVPDSILVKVTRNGGVVMVNFFPAFIDPRAAAAMKDVFGLERQFQAKYPNDPERAEREWMQAIEKNPMPRGTLSQVADHVDHIRKVAGIDHVGIGADMGSVGGLHPAGLEDVSRYPYLVAELLRRGYSDDDVKKVIGLNVLRVMRDAEKVAARLSAARPPDTSTIEQLDGPRTPSKRN
jgi:membrane dipeptidase